MCGENSREKASNGALGPFHPLIARWFWEHVGGPTPIQAESWPEIAAGRHVLITAPTGSGKTLAAFLWALNQLITGRWPPGATRVLYISPLKALNADIRRNLLGPLEALGKYFSESGQRFPEITIATRSGDTEPAERRRMIRRPPEILITTPESVNILLSSKNGSALFGGLATVILDEIHAVAGNKRGVHLVSAVERLARLSGEFQRIALSATVKPVDAVAAFVAGYRLDGEAYTPRSVKVIAVPGMKRFEVQVRFLNRRAGPEDSVSTRPGAASYLPQLAAVCKEMIRRHRSTLIFTNTRRHCESVALLVNQDEPEMLAYSHHGSLSREIRSVVEQRLKSGELKAIVATSSLELGLDIGALDQVLLVGTPMTVSSAVQRLGRAGHQVGAVSRGLLLPLHGRDLIEAAAMAPAVVEQDIESVRPIAGALDVLAQELVSMTGVETWNLDALYEFIRTISVYHELERSRFDLVVDMLAGRYQESRLRFLQALVSVDRIDGTITAKERAVRLLYSSGGTIPDRGYFNLRRQDTQAKIGELDEEFVWERNIGDTFGLGMQSWRIVRITHNDVFVEPSRPRAAEVPFWRAEELDRSDHFSRRIGEFLEWAESALDDPQAFRAELMRRHHLDDGAADVLLDFLRRQRATTRAVLPHRRHVLVEYYRDPRNPQGNTCVVMHTLWGGRINRPLSFALAQAWTDETGGHIEVFSTNEAVILLIPGRMESDRLLALVNPDNVEDLLRRKLESTGFFAGRFRENASRALLLPRHSFGRRMPLWLNRQRSKQLLDAVSKYDDFPILVETWRACMQDEFDLPALKQLLNEIDTGEIRVSVARTHAASPFAAGALWRLTNVFMYEDDKPSHAGPSRLRDDLIKEAIHTAALRPQLPRELVDVFEAKAQRLYPGYAPRSPEDLLDWVKERQFIPMPDWEQLARAVDRDADAAARKIIETTGDKLLAGRFHRPDGTVYEGVVAREQAQRVMAAFQMGPERVSWTMAGGGQVLTADAVPRPRENAPDTLLAEWLAEWLRFYGPRRPEYVESMLPVDTQRLAETLDALEGDRAVVIDYLTAPGDALEICDTENLEILLRLNRAQRARLRVETLPLDMLPLMMAQQQGLTRNEQGLESAIEPLLGIPLAAALLETDILPARIRNYVPALLDELAAETDLMWFGVEEKKIALGFGEMRELFVAPVDPADPREKQVRDQIRRLFADRHGQYYFNALVETAKLNSAALAQILWDLVWAGRVTNDSFAALRKGIQTGYRVKEPMLREGRRLHRAHFAAWKTTRAYPGVWRLLHPPDPPDDALDQEELNKERVRVLLARYGVLFRELLVRELPMLRWANLFRTLRLMELGGELVTGSFFDGIPGLQFASPAMLRALESPPHDAVFWMNATDPASLCGVHLAGLKPSLRKRVPTTHLVYDGARLVVVSKRNGKELEISVPPDHPRLSDYFQFFDVMLTRAFMPVHRIAVERINGERATHSPYTTWLRDHFEISADPRSIWICRQTR